jgi:hypothetical protein
VTQCAEDVCDGVENVSGNLVTTLSEALRIELVRHGPPLHHHSHFPGTPRHATMLRSLRTDDAHFISIEPKESDLLGTTLKLLVWLHDELSLADFSIHGAIVDPNTLELRFSKTLPAKATLLSDVEVFICHRRDLPFKILHIFLTQIRTSLDMEVSGSTVPFRRERRLKVVFEMEQDETWSFRTLMQTTLGILETEKLMATLKRELGVEQGDADPARFFG